MFKRTIIALAVAATAYLGIAQAQESATITLRSGERIQGQLLDHGGVGFTVRVNGQERQIPTNDVAVIEFGGGTMSNEDWAKVSSGQHLLVLRSGETISGSLYDIGGTTPLVLKFRTGSEQREISSNEVTRLVMARPETAATTGGGTGNLAPATGGGIVVPGNQQWVGTGLTVRKGEVLSFNTTGEIQLSNDQNDVAHSAGARSQRYAPNSPLPRNFAGALIGRVGNEVFAIGDQRTVTMPASGQLFLGINDDSVGDNRGEFRVEINRQTRRR